MKAAARTRTEWAKLVKELGESGARVPDFAARHGVNAKTLGWWQAWFRRQATTKGGAHSPARARPTPSARRDIRLVQVRSTAEHVPRAAQQRDEPDVTVDIGRARISIRRGVDADTLATVLLALGVERAR